ncbi:hypothetical protein KO561_13035 [Radiobacillus kanasensis]|uniref:YqaI family protein n=1 Tax=Radiobacillus kanasensis TaxID=2844358 RepID=UPI001E33A4F8|nr:hypothetical protein [Radiobacillus kanasensis]UFT98127.1 hypothetical protein KO561_13035 [Radiobacillus kanasensis]
MGYGIEHPDVTRARVTGYPRKEKTRKPKPTGAIDFFGDDVMEGDSIIVTDNNEIILEENLEDYLIEQMGFRFTKMKGE